MSDSLPPMNEEHRALLAEAAPPIAMPPDVRARALARLAVGVAVVGGGAATTAAMWSAKKSLVFVLCAFVAGTGVGIAGTIAWLDTRAPTPPAPSTPVPVATPRTDVIPSVPFTSAMTSASAPATAAPSMTKNEDQLAAEQHLLDDARKAFGAGDDAASLALLARHRASFPRGALSEERDALTVRALARAGRTDEARNRAEEFRQRYPTSLMRPVVDAAFAPRDGG